MLVSDEPGKITVLVGDWDRSGEYKVEITLDDADAADYNALVLPGGTLNSDKIRDNKLAQSFVKAFMDADKPVAPICHGAWILTEFDAVRGRKMTSTPRIRTDLTKAGRIGRTRSSCADGNLLSSRSPRDLPAFNEGILKAFAEA